MMLDIEGEPTEKLRLCVSAGAPLAADVSEAIEERLGTTLIQGYGMTEAHFSTLDNPDQGKHGSVGYPLPGVDIVIVDDEGQEVQTGEEGEILVKGPNLFTGYIDIEEHLNEDGFLSTGDIGRFEPDERLVIVDRKKDIIIVGGVNVSSAFVEAVLLERLPVSLAAAIGVDDQKYGQVVGAILVLKEGASASEIPSAIYSLHDDYKFQEVPRHYAVVSELPLTENGKVMKAELRKAVENGTLKLISLRQ